MEDGGNGCHTSECLFLRSPEAQSEPSSGFTLAAVLTVVPRLAHCHLIERFSPENLAANAPIVDVLRTLADRKYATPAQIALAWLLAQKPFVVSIPGTRNLNHLEENLGSIKVELTPAELRELEAAFSQIKVHGGRLNEMHRQIIEL